MKTLSLLNHFEEYWGEVVDINDPQQAGRVRVKVVSVFDEIPTENIPFATPRYVDSQSFDRPFLGEIVQVYFLHNDIKNPQWFRIRKSDMNITTDDYESYTLIKNKDLSQYGLDGKLNIGYTKTKGINISLERDGKNSEIIIGNDNTIELNNPNYGRSIHISNESISLGSQTKSQQPAVNGDDNHTALDMLNDTDKKVSETIQKHLDKLFQACMKSPYTTHLAPVFKAYKAELKSVTDKNHGDNDSFFPETLSTIVTLDKD